MRFFPLLAVALLAQTARADPLSDVCSQLIGSQVTQCMAAGNGQQISSSAVEQCGHLIGSQVVSCVAAIAGKDYSPGEASTCGGLIGSQVIDCFRHSGRAHPYAPPPPGPGPGPGSGPGPGRGVNNSEIRAEIAAAIEQLRANDPAGAETRLRRLLRDLR